MAPTTMDGTVILNAEGSQYVASFHLGHGVMTVVSGSVAKAIAIGDHVVAPKSVARIILRNIVSEDPEHAELRPCRHS